MERIQTCIHSSVTILSGFYDFIPIPWQSQTGSNSPNLLFFYTNLHKGQNSKSLAHRLLYFKGEPAEQPAGAVLSFGIVCDYGGSWPYLRSVLAFPECTLLHFPPLVQAVQPRHKPGFFYGYQCFVFAKCGFITQLFPTHAQEIRFLPIGFLRGMLSFNLDNLHVPYLCLSGSIYAESIEIYYTFPASFVALRCVFHETDLGSRSSGAG